MVLKTNKLNDIYVVGFDPDRGPVSQTQSTVANPNSQTTQNGEVFSIVEQQPEFYGGMSALSEYLSQNLHYPKEARQSKIEGRVYIQFVVSETGDIQNLRILKGIGNGCDEEAVRVVSQMPKWRPGKQQGKPVAVQYNLPIQFALKKKEDKRTGMVEPAMFNPTGSPIGDFPTMRTSNYPNLPQLTTVSGSISASLLVTDTTIRSDSERQSGPSIRVRGNRPLGLLGEKPLYILDGAEAPADIMNSIDPNLIESITVLKDASASAIYGEKGKNGVVIITTKKK